MTSISAYYAAAATAPAGVQRRYAAGAAYRLYEAARNGESINVARGRLMSLPQYSAALVAAGLDDDLYAVDDVGVANPGPFFTDTFTDTNGTSLTAHTGEGGQWTIHPAYSANSQIASNRLRATATNTAGVYVAPVPAPSADTDVTANVYIADLTNRGFSGPIARMDPTADTYYWARADNGAGANKVDLIRVVNGANTVPGTFATTFSAAQTVAITIQPRGATINVLVDGVQRITFTDPSPITQAGRFGLRNASTIAPTDTNSVQTDSVTAT